MNNKKVFTVTAKDTHAIQVLAGTKAEAVKLAMELADECGMDGWEECGTHFDGVEVDGLPEECFNYNDESEPEEEADGATE